MDGEAEAVPQAVHVADSGAGMAARRGVAGAFEVVQHRFLQRACRLTRLRVGVERDLTGAQHSLVRCCNFSGYVAGAPGTRHIVMIAAAVFTREEIEDQGLAAAQRLVILAAAVREAGIAPLGEDHARVFQVVVQQNAADETPQSADGQRPAGIIGDQFVPGPVAGDKVPGRAQGGVGARGDAADALQLVRIARHGRLVEERHTALTAELVALQRLQLRQQLDQILRSRAAVNADTPGRHVQALQGPAPQAGQGALALAVGFLQQLRPVQLLPADRPQGPLLRASSISIGLTISTGAAPRSLTTSPPVTRAPLPR